MSKKANRIALLAKNGNISSGITKADDGWNDLTQVENYVEKIELPKLNTDTDIQNILTAIPSPWARAYMQYAALLRPYFTDPFRKSADYAGETKDTVQGMDSLYLSLQEEWKGLIALLALKSENINVERIVLEYVDDLKYDELNDAQRFERVKNVYQLKGAFGNMLFADSNVWGAVDRPDGEYNPPYFQLIKFDDILIAATHPRSLAYPAAHYKELENKNISWFKKGKLVDPLHHLKAPELDKLYHYVNQIRKNLETYDSKFSKNEVNTINLKKFLQDWAQEIRLFVEQKHTDFKMRDVGVLDFFNEFHSPFDIVFNIDMKIYKHEGKYLTENVTGDLEELNPDQLLLDAKKSKIILLKSGGFNDYLATALEAIGDDGEKYFFSLPLSELGLREFYSNLNTLLKFGKGDKNISAKYIKSIESVEVTLEVEIDGHKTPFSKIYKIQNVNEPLDTNVVLWPNFTASNWNSYYMYSEVLHNDDKIKGIPLISKSDDYEELMYKKGTENELYYITDELDVPDHLQQADAHLLVSYDKDRLKGSDLKYEIYNSNVPFKGIELRGNEGDYDDYNCGYILLDDSKSDAEKGIINLDENELAKVDVGIDFGSTNTTISYRTGDDASTVLSSRNRRRFLLGHDINDNNSLAKPNELFFFQNDEPGYFYKSSLLTHHRFRLKNAPSSFANVITGGFPVWEENLNIIGGDEEKVLLDINNTNAEILHDLKWRKQDQHIKNKKAFLKTIWLLINAELFSDNKRPVSLSWSYPTSMPNSVRHDLEGVYSEMVNTIVPINDNSVNLAQIGGDKNLPYKVLSESEAVSEYVLNKGGVSVSKDTVLINFDIGGTTSDISILVNDPGDKRANLIRQTSAKIAANRMSTAAKFSKDLRKCIEYFVKKNQLNIKCLEEFDKNSDVSTYLLNIVFNKLEKNKIDGSLFYNQCWNPDDDTLDRGETRGLFAIASYISGLLLFHTAQKVRGLIENGELKQKKYHIKFNSFGKGGRLFDWLRNGVNENEANKYYEDCFRLGSQRDSNDLDIIASFGNYEVAENTKKEVAFGLVNKYESFKSDSKSGSEVIGEDGYKFKGKPLSWNQEITPEMIHEFGEALEFPTNSELPRFTLFIDRYISLVRDWNVFDTSVIKSEISNFAERKLENYVKTDAAWIDHKMTANKLELKDFKLTASPFLYEGMCFLDEVLIPKLYSLNKDNTKPTVLSAGMDE